MALSFNSLLACIYQYFKDKVFCFFFLSTARVYISINVYFDAASIVQF